ncbi:hypothetical protein Clacol_010327 [Clathrus columnatus]|uniref:Uncharacterized protein n=1 Tax=Clathrus columnatus TaxID=1419009 RepID=A0AAV5ATT4_9AGAM|nr:hypothetical protein Clacol_010327 [Clathrus columnatus]
MRFFGHGDREYSSSKNGMTGLLFIRTYALCQGYQPMTIALSATFLTASVSGFYIALGTQLCTSSGFLISVLLLCEFTIDLRRRNQQNSVPNQSALHLPTILFQENPVQSVRFALGRLHESIVAEMGERNDIANVDDLGLGEPDHGLQDSSPGADLDYDLYDQAQHA